MFNSIGIFTKSDINSEDILSPDENQILHTVVKDIINDKILPIIAQKVRHYEHSVKSTRKGFTNYLKNAFNKKDRSENDGLRNNFVMNTAERSMKNLIDLSFLTQDYRTFLAYVKYPSNDFKSIKAYKHLSSCSELQFFCYIMTYEGYMETKEFRSNLFDTSNSYVKANDYKLMTRNLIIIAEL